MDKNMITPPLQLGHRRGIPAVKPKDMKGTLLRLWRLTSGHRRGLGWILFFSALASSSAILSPYLIGNAVNCIDSGNPLRHILVILAVVYLGDWLIRFLQQFLMESCISVHACLSIWKNFLCPFLTHDSMVN